MLAYDQDDCRGLNQKILKNRRIIFVSNRGPFSFHVDEGGQMTMQRSGGGLVTALLSLAHQVPSTWIAAAGSEEDRQFGQGAIPIDADGSSILMRFVDPDPQVYEDYYGVISNPLLWFLQHSIWDYANAPAINRDTWKAWNDGYVRVNQLFADAVVKQLSEDSMPSLVMLQDYHLYLAPRMIRSRLRGRQNVVITHFVHIPWPGPEDWGMLPRQMRESILTGLCAVDLLGFQTREDALNFIRTCESLLPGVQVNYRTGRVMLHNRVTHVRDFPISIDVRALREQCESEEVQQYYQQLAEITGGRHVILRIDRSEPSKNIVRGFQAFDELLETHPELREQVQFLALLVPSRLEVEEYQDYLKSLMAASGTVNAKYGNTEWEPVRVLVGESYPRAIAAMQLYDVLLVNPVADGMNLVAKEGPVVNDRAGVVVLSERAGAVQQLGDHALVISPCDISATAEALNMGLTMPQEERQRRAGALRKKVEDEDIQQWLCWQLDAVQKLVDLEEKKHARR